MTFERHVEINGSTYGTHQVTSITHENEGMTTLRVRSRAAGSFVDTEHMLDLDVGMTFEEAELAVMAMPSFAEAGNPLQEVVDELSEMLTDEQAAAIPGAYREWADGVRYATGDRRRFGTGLYKCLQAHTSQADQTPDVAVSLWAAIIASEDPDQPLPWVQPDSTNPYMKGDKVRHNEKIWESLIDYNVYEPGTVGTENIWMEVA